MKILSKKEGGFYNNKLLVVSALVLMMIGVVWFVFADATNVPVVTFNVPSLNGSFTSSSTPFINITFAATESTDVNITILNSSINVTINNVVYNYSNMTCNYTFDSAVVNSSITCGFSTQPLMNGTYNIVASAMDNTTNLTGNAGSVTATLYNYTIYTGTPKVVSVEFTAGNNSGTNITKAGTTSITITFDRIMNTSLNATVNVTNGTGGIGNLSTVVSGLSWTNDTANRRSSWTGNYTFLINGTTDGPFNINVSGAQDIVGNTMLANGSYTMIKDTIGPFVSLETVNRTNQSTYSLAFNFIDNLSTSAYCRLYINSTVNATNTAVVNATSTVISIADSSQEGVFQWIVECNDTANNRANATGWYIVNVDKTAPVINGTSAPLNGRYVRNLTLPVIVENITDAFTGVVVNSSPLNISYYKAAAGNIKDYYAHTGSPAIIVSGTSNVNYRLSLTDNSMNTATGDIIYIITQARDHANNSQTRNTTFYIDNTPPVLGTPTIGASYTQGDNFTITVTASDANAGLNKTNASFGINTTTYLSLGNVNFICTAGTCTYSYNTSALEAGSLRLNGTITAYDNTDNLSNVARNNSVALDFTLVDVGNAPVITAANVTYNLTRVVRNITAVANINVSAFDESGINTIWATYNDNGTLEKCTFFEKGTIATTSVKGIGNCTINASSVNIPNNLLVLSIYVNDTTGAGNSAPATTHTLKVENEAINVSSFTAPSSIYVNQTITINTTVFSWYGKPAINFNLTNSSTTDGVTLNATCTVLDANASLYYCANITNTSVLTPPFAGNTSTISIVYANLSNSGAYVDTSLPSALTTTFYAGKTVTVDTAPSTSTIKFVGSDVWVTGAATAQTAFVGSTLQDIQIIDTTLNNTVITLNDVNLTAMTNFTFEIVAPNRSNGTNYSRIQASLTTGVATLLTSVVIQPKINNASTTGFTGSTIAFNCTALGVTCGASTRVYKANFNTTTNLTTAGTWTKITDANTAWSSPILTVTVDSFSIFALATPYVAPTTETTTTTTSSGGGGGGIGYKLVGKITAFDLIDMIRDFYEGTSKKTAFDIIDSIRKFYEEEAK